MTEFLFIVCDADLNSMDRNTVLRHFGTDTSRIQPPQQESAGAGSPRPATCRRSRSATCA